MAETPPAAPTTPKPAAPETPKPDAPKPGEEEKTPAAKAEDAAKAEPKPKEGEEPPAKSKGEGAIKDPPKPGEKDPPKDPDKTDDGKPKVEKKDERVIPETYDLKLPEGSSLAKADIDRIAANAKEQKLTLDEAQADLEIEHETVHRYVEAQQAAHTEKVKSWLDETQKDTEVGGGSPEQFKENAALIGRVVDKFAPVGFKKSLETSGLGNQVAVNQFLLRIGKAMAEDKIVPGGTPPKDKKTLAEKLYPDQGK